MKLETENVQETEASAELIRELMADDTRRGLEENVANHLRQGYGGQDVKMLPRLIPIVNERKAAVKKKMVAAGFVRHCSLCRGEN